MESVRVRLFYWAVAGAILLGSGSARAEHVDCLDRPTLESLINCVRSHMPPKHSHGFVVPTLEEQSDWRSTVWAMLNGSCENIFLPAGLAGSYTVRKFIDREVGLELCVLSEGLDADEDGHVDKGWGTFITNPRPLREINVLAPHPISDMQTHLQSVQVFKGTRARSVLVAGAHRAANGEGSGCGPSRVSDPTHSLDTMFQPTVQEMMGFYDQTGREYGVLQFHGMASTTCAGVDVYLSNGTDIAPGADDKISELRANLERRQPGWSVTTPGSEQSCDMQGAKNVQIRLLGGVPYDEVCETPASEVNPRFIQIEQKKDARDGGDWVDAINDTWPRYVASRERRDGGAPAVPADVLAIPTPMATTLGADPLTPP